MMGNTPAFLDSLKAGVSNFETSQLTADANRMQELNAHWTGLAYLGISLDFTESALLCSHRENGFSCSIPYDQADSEELRRKLFRELRTTFGSLTDRYLSSVFQPSQQVEKLFASFRALLSVCNSIARQRQKM